MKRLLLSFLLVTQLSSFADPKIRPDFDWTALKSTAIQHRGRLKPFDTYARETVQFVTGKTSWEGYGASELIIAWLTAFDEGWDTTKFVRVDYEPLKREIGLDPATRFFSPQELRSLPKMMPLLQSAAKKNQARERLNELEKKAQEVDSKIRLLDSVIQGNDLSILPNAKGLHEDWFSLAQLADGQGIPYTAAEVESLRNHMRPVLEAYPKSDAKEWNEAMPAFRSFLKELSRGQYPPESDLNRELGYNKLRPFRWAWVIYALAFCFLLTAVVSQNKQAKLAGAAILVAGFAMHSYGFVLRMLISDRPPVTNMYESVIWVTWGCVLFAFIIWGAYKNVIIPTAATVFAVAGLVLADNLPFILDPNIHPLEPVLRSNFWLTIHVLIITLSYAAFGLSLCLGNVVLGNYLWHPDRNETIQALQLYMYRAVQIGVVLLAAGTILGGVWADYSWGRFWGWDPKEVWALIALLLYLAVLHGRFAGWLKGFGFATTTVMCFLGVLMAWYGVNFVLGAGLHSYGFGSGGGGYVLGYMVAQLAFVGAAWVRYDKAKKAGKVDMAIFPRKK